MKKIAIGFVLVIMMIGCASANMVSSSDKEYKYSEYTSKYADIDNGAIDPGTYGYVVFRISGTSVQDNTVWYQNVKQRLKFDYTYHPDKTAIDGQNPGFEKVELLTDGSMPEGAIPLGAGEYTAYLQRGNGAQPETQNFKIGGGQVTYVPFIGDSIPTVVVKEAPAPTPTDPECVNVYHPGYVEWKKVKVCGHHGCCWIWVPVYHCGYWEKVCQK